MRARARSAATVTSSASRYCSTLAHNANETNQGPSRPAPVPVVAGGSMWQAVLRLVVELDRVRDEGL